MTSLDRLSWSADVAQAAWIGERLTASGEILATRFVPSGFEAYARVLHPADARREGEPPVRWREIAAWSGMRLDPYVSFYSVALPPEPAAGPPPWSGQGPHHGGLFPPDATAVIDRLRRHTATPERCWFCLWDGYGWLADMVPEEVDAGQRVRLPLRDYYLYHGAVDSALVGYPGEPPNWTANLWWPEDRAWCVASEIDFSWSYVGGSAVLVQALVGDPAIEAFEVSPDVPVAGFGACAWIERWVSDAVDALSSGGHALVSTPVGTVEAWLELPPSPGRASLRTSSRSVFGNRASAEHFINTAKRDHTQVRDALSFYLRWDIIALVGD